MTNDELDTLWFWARHDAIKAGEDSTRHRFAALVAAAEREACAKLCESEGAKTDASWASCASAIRARGN